MVMTGTLKAKHFKKKKNLTEEITYFCFIFGRVCFLNDGHANPSAAVWCSDEMCASNHAPHPRGVVVLNKTYLWSISGIQYVQCNYSAQ